jgi:molybdate transport system permease protein
LLNTAFFPSDNLEALMILSASDWRIVGFTLWTAILAVACDLIPAIALAWTLARKSWPGKGVVETLASLPLVMPPVATGLLLLEIFGRRGWLGSWLYKLGIEIVFTWKAVVVAMAVMSFPFILQSGRIAFEAIDGRLEQVASTLGGSPLRIAWTITGPLAARGIAAGAVMAFTRALGEFGATILVAGNIPGYTTTISTSTYSKIMLGKDHQAFTLILISVLLAFGMTFLSNTLVRRRSS